MTVCSSHITVSFRIGRSKEKKVLEIHTPLAENILGVV